MIKHFLFLKTYYKTIKKDHSKTDLNLILTMVDELDKNCDRKIFNKFKKHPYAKTFFKQKNLKEVVMQKQRHGLAFHSCIFLVWSQPV